MAPQDQLQLLLDEREIREVIYRYVHACDRLDEDEMRTVYHPGAHDEHGPLRGPESEFRPNVLQVLRLAYSFCSHTLGQSRIDFADPDTAFVETYVIAATGREVDGDELIEVVGGRSPRPIRTPQRSVEGRRPCLRAGLGHTTAAPPLANTGAMDRRNS